MIFWSAPRRAVILLLVCFSLNGCLPTTETSLDEEKNPHFLAGKSKVMSLDYRGAVESFEKALEANPRSASAHKELGVLYFERINDPAAAIYHFEKLLKLRPSDPHADTFRQFIVTCKQELARNISLGPVTKQLQDELKRLTTENTDLHRQIDFLRAQLAQRPSAPTNAPAPRLSTATNAAASPSSMSPRAETPKGQTPPSVAPLNPATNLSRVLPAATSRTHVIKPRETYYTVAARYGVKIDSLRAANPGVDPRKLKVGQIINVPSR